MYYHNFDCLFWLIVIIIGTLSGWFRYGSWSGSGCSPFSLFYPWWYTDDYYNDYEWYGPNYRLKNKWRQREVPVTRVLKPVAISPEKDFHDDKIDALINEYNRGKRIIDDKEYTDIMAYISSMSRIAREVGDKQSAANFEGYREKVRRAAAKYDEFKPDLIMQKVPPGAKIAEPPAPVTKPKPPITIKTQPPVIARNEPPVAIRTQPPLTAKPPVLRQPEPAKYTPPPPPKPPYEPLEQVKPPEPASKPAEAKSDDVTMEFLSDT